MKEYECELIGKKENKNWKFSNTIKTKNMKIKRRLYNILKKYHRFIHS